MLRIVCTQKSEVSFPFLVDKTYKVGRKQGDITLPDDQSISRLHAEIVVEHPAGNFNEPLLTPVLVLTDVGSKFGTFASEDGIKNKITINAREHVTLSIGDKLRFGLQWNEFRIDYTPLVVTTSSLKVKAEFKDQIVRLGGHFVDEWNGYVTHVIMESVTLTVKAVCALLAGKPIVTPSYISDLVSSYETQKPQPDFRNFLPPIAEKGLPNITKSSFYPNSARTTLFAGKTFLFCMPKHLKKLKPAIDAGGGTCKLVSDADRVNVLSDDYIIVGNTQSIATGEQDPVTKHVLEHYRRGGKRVIGDSEIGLAAIYNNIDKHCNPRHSLKDAILPHLTTQTQSSSSASIIVPETQDANESIGNTSRDVVDETILKANTSNSSVDSAGTGLPTAKVEKRSAPSSSDVLQPGSSKKRSAVETLTGPNTKRRKEAPPPPILSRSTRSSSRTLTSLFNVSDSEEDESDVVPESPPPESIVDDPETVPESQPQPPLVSVVDVRDLQSPIDNTQGSLRRDHVFKIPSTVAEPTQVVVTHNPTATDNIMTITESIMNAKTVPAANTCLESIRTASCSRNSSQIESPNQVLEPKDGVGRKRRRGESDEEVRTETSNKKINLDDEKVRSDSSVEATVPLLVTAPLVIKPLINKNVLRRESSVVDANDLSGCTPRKNYKSFKKVLPKFLAANGVENSSVSPNLNATVESIRSSLKSFKMIAYDYTPGPTISYRCDTPPPLEDHNGRSRDMDMEVARGFEAFNVLNTQPSGSTRANKNGNKPGTSEKAPPQRRTSPRKKAPSPAIQSSPSPLKFGPLPVEEDDEDDMWTFNR